MKMRDMETMSRFPSLSRLRDTQLLLSQKPLPYVAGNRAEVDAYWRACVSTNPRLWNGPFFMFDGVRIEDGVLHGTGYRTDFATFLHWRAHGRSQELVHITGTSLPVTEDGALFAVQMAAHTANAGEVYFPAGSFDPNDLRNGVFDVAANIGRELLEETGFLLECDRPDEGFVAVFENGCLHVAKQSRLPGCFGTCAAMLSSHQLATGDDEIESAIAIRRNDHSRMRLRSSARMLADWHFSSAG
ncbi:hypothetical protein [Oricola cellulosilytica]|uniref:NUDIX hydrolase n=1 Tax=Oricola cellulosilytica TaxID=1429082 RepID=A0A4R0PCI3_9HYPH|nr:hypothetical protein [Oricola cellulosilytica]TCD15180.1 hypothetical protein E0D97_06430 [Oricola cellulosilytica]